MALDPSVLELFQQTVYLATYQGRDDAGDPVHADPAPIKVRMDPVFRTVLSTSGEEEQSAWEIITNVPIGINDRVWVGAPTVDDDAHRVKQVEPIIDERGLAVVYQVLI